MEDELKLVCAKVLSFLEDAYFADDTEEKEAHELADELRRVLYSA